MSGEPLLEPDAHSAAEVEAAIQDLSGPELQSLKKSALFRLRALGRLSQGRDWEDLLQEAVLLTLDGRRKWKQGVEFAYHLKKTMQSTCNSWRRKLDRINQAGAAEQPQAVRLTSDEEVDRVIETATSNEHHRRTALESVEAAKQRLGGDEEALMVILGWETGLDGPGVRQDLGLSEKEYRAAVRRIRRAASREL